MDIYLEKLKKLISINSVSPINIKSLSLLDDFFSPYDLLRFDNGRTWVKRTEVSNIWIYCHVDTKPIGEKSEWKTDPFQLVGIRDSLYGRGVSDSKFQMLNAIDFFSELPVNIIIDGEEECGGTEAGNYLLNQGNIRLIVVDGASQDISTIYTGLKGQLDGKIILNSGLESIHPGREVRTHIKSELINLLKKFDKYHFNMTKLEGGLGRSRSLTLEEVIIYFDIRYDKNNQEDILSLLKDYDVSLKQRYSPLTSKKNIMGNMLAPFSSPLGNQLRHVDELYILPGGHNNNRAHLPNEFITFSQIIDHKNLILNFWNFYNKIYFGE